MSAIKVVETGKYGLQYSSKGFVFDSVFKFHSDLGTGLYTEGTGNLYNVKAATNPVEVTFRKNQIDADSIASTPKQTVILDSFDGEILWNGSEIETPTNNGAITDSTIYEWIEGVNKGSFDRQDITVNAEVQLFYSNQVTSPGSDIKIVPLFILKNAILIAADIRRNPYKGATFSELSFVADGVDSSINLSRLKGFSTFNQALHSTVVSKTEYESLSKESKKVVIDSKIKVLEDRIAKLVIQISSAQAEKKKELEAKKISLEQQKASLKKEFDAL